MNTVGVVVEIKGKYAVVETERKSACDGCHKNADGQGCAMCHIFGGNTRVRTNAKNAAGASVGDKVELESSSGRMLGYALLVFILPLIACLAAYFITAACVDGEAIPGAVALAAFVICFGTVALISRTVISKRCDVEIVKIVDKSF
jgi:sigma-E factor negative regulatory protein RseC